MSVVALPMSCLRQSPSFCDQDGGDRITSREDCQDIVQRLSHRADILLLAASDLYEATSPSAGLINAEWRQVEQLEASRSLGVCLHDTLQQFLGWRSAHPDGAEGDGNTDETDEESESESHERQPRHEHNIVLSYRGVVRQFLALDLPTKLLASMSHLQFEARKAAVHILCAVFESATWTRDAVAEYMASRPRVLEHVLDMSIHEDMFFLGSQIVHAMAQCSRVASLMFEKGFVLQLLHLAAHPNFEISHEVFASVRDLLLKHKQMAAAHLDAKFEVFFQFFHVLIVDKQNYVMQRQSLKLLGLLLLDAEFQCFMLRYVQQQRFLKIHMDLLRDASQTIPIDAFHVLKLFVANPQQSLSVQNIFRRNNKRLVALLETFRRRGLDDGCLEDLDMVIDMLESLPSPTSSCASSPASR